MLNEAVPEQEEMPGAGRRRGDTDGTQQIKSYSFFEAVVEDDDCKWTSC